MKEWNNKYNSFNSSKALIHVPYWSQYKDGIIPPPLFVSVDPCGVCNFKCNHCNANKILSSKRGMMNQKTIDTLLVRLREWKTKSVCIGGGGEPLLNNDTYYLIDSLDNNNIQIALVTNGFNLNTNIESILKCTYLGISVDAATKNTFGVVKGINGDFFGKVITNISNITKKGLEVCYKYLLLPTNVNEVYDACKIAKDIGCDLFHVRPGSDPWFDSRNIQFSKRDIELFDEQIAKARTDFEDKQFKIFSVVNKFNSELKPVLTFNKCYACFTTCFISFDGTIGLCCDRRGDSHIVLGNIEDTNVWGSEKHKLIHEQINVEECPRCTFCHVNEIFENVILEDKMFYNFF
jgi:MoaA/NifB/PqqE/SkfB family radical SAM enzyme